MPGTKRRGIKMMKIGDTVTINQGRYVGIEGTIVHLDDSGQCPDHQNCKGYRIIQFTSGGHRGIVGKKGSFKIGQITTEEQAEWRGKQIMALFAQGQR